MKYSTKYILITAVFIIVAAAITIFWQTSSDKKKYRNEGIKSNALVIDKTTRKYYTRSNGHSQLQIDYCLLLRYEVKNVTPSYLQDAYVKVSYEENLKYNSKDTFQIYYLKNMPTQAKSASYIESNSLFYKWN